MKNLGLLNFIVMATVSVIGMMSYIYTTFATIDYVQDRHKEVMHKLDVIDSRLYQLLQDRK